MLAETRKLLPDAPVIYVADYAALPYGEKTEAQVVARVCGLLGRLTEIYRPRLVCIACNTASTIALGMVRDVLEIPVVGTVPAIKPAAAMTKTGVIGLLGTAATIRQAYVDDLERDFASDKLLLRHAAPELVAQAENKLRGKEVEIAVVEAAVEGLLRQPRGKDIDTVVLACTHFPLLGEELQAGFGPDVELIHGAAGIARRIEFRTRGQKFSRSESDRFVYTGQNGEIEKLRPDLSSYGLENIEPL